MYIFNPEHDLCLANGDIHFVPPASALAFGSECASLTEFMAGLDADADSDYPQVKKILPWGWNSLLKERLLKKGYSPDLMPTDEELRNIKVLSDRRVALKALELLSREGSNSGSGAGLFTNPNYRIAAGTIEEVVEFINKEKNVVLKAPLSGSGKGIRFVANELSHSDEGWCRNLIKKHGCVVVEKRFLPLLEFAMLFKCSGPNKADKTEVEFIGYSLFYTQNGMYKGNILASDEWIENEILKYTSKTTLELARESLYNFLKSNVASKYNGFVGVDQFIYKPFGDDHQLESEPHKCYGYNPVVEINMRMTMGLMAHNIYKKSANDLPNGSHYFEILREPKEGRIGYSYKIAPIDAPTTSPLP